MKKAIYVSVWDDGIEVRTPCMYDATDNRVSGIVPVDLIGVDILKEEYVELDDGTIIRDIESYNEYE